MIALLIAAANTEGNLSAQGWFSGEGPAGTALVFLLTAVFAYFCGCFNGSVIVSKYILHNDVRKYGSGNAGLTNFYRTFGGPLTFLVLMTDVLKLILAVLFGIFAIGSLGFDPMLGKLYAGLFCLIGHMFPFMFGFRGGKGILSGGALVCMLDWRIALVAFLAFFSLSIRTRYVSLGSLAAAISVPITTGVIFQDLLYTLLAAFIGGLIVWMHRGNIRRLVKGQEAKFSFRRKKEEPK